MSFGNTSTSVGQSGKSGGDVSGFANASAGGFAGGGGSNVGVSASGSGGIGIGIGGGGGSAGGDASAQAGGDVTDNTSIGSISINS
jgi:hypothetical protein